MTCYLTSPNRVNPRRTRKRQIERFNRIYREEVLDCFLFESLTQIREITQRWVSRYNQDRPHDASTA